MNIHNMCAYMYVLKWILVNGLMHYCRDTDGNKVDNANGIISGTVTAVEIPVMVNNNRDDAFGARITVTHNSVLLFSRAVTVRFRLESCGIYTIATSFIFQIYRLEFLCHVLQLVVVKLIAQLQHV